MDNWDDLPMSYDVSLKNINVTTNVTTNVIPSGRKVILDGDCEFDAFTVESGGTLDLNGQRMECSGAFVNEGTTNWGGAGALHIAKMFTINGDNDEEAGANFIVTGSSSGDNMDFDDTSFVGDATSNILINNGTTSVDWDTSESYVGNLIVGSPMISIHGTKNQCGNLIIPTGGSLDVDNDTITVKGDFTTSGGLIGKSAFNFDGASGDINCGSDSTIDNIFDSGGTAEAWINADSDGETNNGRIFGKHYWNLALSNEDSGKSKLYFYYNFDGNDASWKSDLLIENGKWHHVAVTYDNGNVTNQPKLYIDGKQVVATQNDIPTGTRNTDATQDFIIGNDKVDGKTFDGRIAKVAIWSHILTEAELRTGMFYDFAAMEADDTVFPDSSRVGGTGVIESDLKFWSQFDEGTGSAAAALADRSGEGNHGNITLGSSAWAGGGTFDVSDTSSKLIFSKSGAATFTYLDNEELNKLTVNNGCNLTLKAIDTHNDGTPNLFVDNSIDIQGTLISNNNEYVNFRQAFVTNSGTIAVGDGANSIKDVKLFLMEHTSGTISFPASTTKYLRCAASGGTTRVTGDFTLTTALRVDSGATFNSNSQKLNMAEVDVNGGTFNITDSNVNFTTSGIEWNMTATSTLIAQNSTCNGYSAATPTLMKLPDTGQDESTSDFQIIGNIKNFKATGDTDITVVGTVTDCVVQGSEANVYQWHHTLDTAQLLDADAESDDDIKLPKPSLDNSTELQTGG